MSDRPHPSTMRSRPAEWVDCALRHAIAVTGGQHGANEIAMRLSVRGTDPVIMNASEVVKWGEVLGEEVRRRYGICIYVQGYRRDGLKTLFRK